MRRPVTSAEQAKDVRSAGQKTKKEGKAKGIMKAPPADRGSPPPRGARPRPSNPPSRFVALRRPGQELCIANRELGANGKPGTARHGKSCISLVVKVFRN